MNNTYLNNLNNDQEIGLSEKSISKRLKWIGIGVLFIAIILTIVFATKTATADRERERIKQVTSVQIQQGDTLWSIASRYFSDEYRDVNDYIDEIMISNGLESDTIHAGNYIIVPYFADASMR